MREKRRDIHTEVSARNRVLTRKIQKFHETGQPLLTVIGGTSVGKKTGELIEKSDCSSQAGFLNNPRFVLSMEFFGKFRERSGVDDIPDNNFAEKRKAIFDTDFSENEIKEFLKLVKKFRVFFGSIPFVARSSPPNDCRGTGVFKSSFFANLRKEHRALENLIGSIKDVLAGEFNPDALALSRDLGWDPGMAVMIEPVAGQFYTGSRFAGANLELFYGPKYGGMAHTSRADGKQRLYVSPGLPTTSVNGKVLEIEMDNLDLLVRRPGILRSRDERLCAAIDHEQCDAFTAGDWIDFPNIRIISPAIEHGGHNDPIHTILFEKLEQLERLLGPQYLEFAITEFEGELSVFLIQIADIKRDADFYAFPETGKSIMELNFVVGSGIRDCNGAIVVREKDDLLSLEEYNEGHEDYLLIFEGDLIPYCGEGHGIKYYQFSNASAVVELYRRIHATPPHSHFKGMIEESGKIYMVGKELDEGLLNGHLTHMDPNIYDVCVRVTASERRQKAIVEIL